MVAVARMSGDRELLVLALERLVVLDPEDGAAREELKRLR